MMTKEEWEKKWPQLAYNPSLLEGDNAEKAMNMTLDEKIKAAKDDEIKTVKHAAEYKKYRISSKPIPGEKVYDQDCPSFGEE